MECVGRGRLGQVFLSLLAAGVVSLTACAVAVLPSVPPADLSAINLEHFMDEELDNPMYHEPSFPLPYYLEHFHRLANAVTARGPYRGFIDIKVWRHPQHNGPHNARVMENILSLAYFYSVDRPWNSYHGSPAVRQRLEAALEFWIRSQDSDGAFTEVPPDEPRLAPTAFATKFMGQTLMLLADGPPIDETLHRRVIAAQRRSLMHVFTYEPFYEHGKSVSNQFGNAWAGALAYLSLFDDPEIEQHMRRRLASAREEFQSPAGYFYEHDGPDWEYNLGTHFSNVHMAWHHAKGTKVGNWLLIGQRRFFEWLSYNAVMDSTSERFVLNSAVETRRRQGTLGWIESSMGKQIELARAFSPTVEEVEIRRKRIRARLERDWPEVPELREGESWAYSPYAFLHRDHSRWHPTEAQRKAARAKLPYLLQEHFTHQRADDRHPFVFTFVRRPSYYAIFNAGTPVTEQQRLGLGLLWHPQAGTLIQSQSGSTALAWGTRRSDSSETVAEAHDVQPRYGVEGRVHAPVSGNYDLPDGPVELRYELEDLGTKTLVFQEQEVHVSLDCSQPCAEQLPLVIGERDELHVAPNRVQLRRGDVTLDVAIRGAESVELAKSESRRVGERRVMGIHVHTRERLEYRLSFRRIELHSAGDPVSSPP